MRPAIEACWKAGEGRGGLRAPTTGIRQGPCQAPAYSWRRNAISFCHIDLQSTESPTAFRQACCAAYESLRARLKNGNVQVGRHAVSRGHQLVDLPADRKRS